MTRAVVLCGAAVFLLAAVPARAAVDEEAILCIECHADMSDAHAAIVTDWRGSLLYANDVTCGQCHGFSDTDFDAMPEPGDAPHAKPDTARTVAMCAKCHRQALDYYPLSAHFQKKRQSCLMCHATRGGSHDLQAASLDIIQPERCSKCHEYDWALQAKEAFAAADHADAHLNETVEALAEKGYHSTRLKDLHATAHDIRDRLPLELHTFRLARIKAVSESLTELDTFMNDEEARILRKLGTQARRQKVGIAVMVSCFFLSALILAFRQTYIDDWRAEHGPPPADL